MTMKTTVIMIMTLLLKTIRNGSQMVFVEDFVIILINWRWWTRYHQGWKSNGVPWRLFYHNHDHADEMMVMITISSGLEVEWCSLNKELQLSPIWNLPPHSTPSWRHSINRCQFYILMFCYIEIQKRSEQYNRFVPFFTSSASFKYFNANFRHFTLILNVFMLIVDVF